MGKGRVSGERDAGWRGPPLWVRWRGMQGGGEPPSVGSVERDAGWRGTPLCGFGGEGCREPPCGVAAMLLMCGLQQQTCFTSRLCGFGPR